MIRHFCRNLTQGTNVSGSGRREITSGERKGPNGGKRWNYQEKNKQRKTVEMSKFYCWGNSPNVKNELKKGQIFRIMSALKLKNAILLFESEMP